MAKMIVWILLIICFLPNLVLAKKTASIQQASTNADEAKNTTNTVVSGYIDGSYNYLVKDNKFTSGVFDRVYDVEENGFTLHQLAVTLAKQPSEGMGALLNVIVGYDANITAAYGWNPYFGSQTLAIDPLQAYFQYSFNSFTIIGGKFTTLASYEAVDPTSDTNFSRSILWGYATPTTALGFRITYTANEKWKFIAGLNNGWDNIRDTSRRKTIELGIAYTPNKCFTLSAQAYSGGQRAEDRTATGPQSIRDLIDIVAIWNITDKLTSVLNYDYGNQTKALLPAGNIAKAVWQGIAGYVNYKFNEKWRTSIRGEIFSDRNGYRTGVAQAWKELTLTLAFAPIKNAELRAETRRDFSNVNSFLNSNGISSANYQQSYALEGFYKFG